MIWFLHSADEEPTPSPARAIIVTVVIGESYEAMWTQLCAASWLVYAERFGFDIVVFKDRLDKSDARSPAWQKLLILDLPWMQRYERAIWLDSDIIISRTAPNILDYAGPAEKVGASLEGSRLSPAEQQIYLERWHKTILRPDGLDTLWPQTQVDAYLADGAPPHEELFNTGVMVLSPRHHRELLLGVYGCPEATRLFEQAHLSHRLIEGGLAYVISPRFNWGILESARIYLNEEVLAYEDQQTLGRIVSVLVRTELRNAYFLHFYGAMNLMQMFVREPEGAAAAA